MRIAILLPDFSGGGAERAAQVLGDYLILRGYNVFYFILNKKKKQRYQVGGEIVWVDIEKYRSINYADSVWVLGQAARIIRTYKKLYKIQVAISFMEECNLLNVLSRNREKVCVSVRTALGARDEMRGFLFQKDLLRKLYSRADSIVAVSQYVRDELVYSYGLPAYKTVVIPNAAKQHECEENRSKWIYGNKVILCTGRLEPVKQQDHMIKVFSYIKKTVPEAELILCGEGPTEKYLRKLCRYYNVEDSVYFVGFTSHPGFYMKHARVFVMTSAAEGFPNSIVEAMAYGLPVVTTDSPGGCGEIVGKKEKTTEYTCCTYGILTPYFKGKISDDSLSHEERELARAVMEMLTKDDLYIHYSALSKQRAKCFSYEKTMSCWERLLHGCPNRRI